jgi:hypothetical protein
MADLRTELAKIYEQYGKLTAEIVLEEATPVDHPLHSQFTWDDSEAARLYRLEEARRLIRIVRDPITTSSGEVARVRTYHSLPQEGGDRAYQSTDDIVKDDISTQILLRQAEREYRTLLTKYGHLKEFIEMVRASLLEEVA